MAHFNAFEEAVDFSFWRQICEEYGTLRHYKRGEYFAHSFEVLKRVGWIISGGFKHTLIAHDGNTKAVGFVFGKSVLANYLSAMLGKPLPTDIIAIDDSDVLVLPAEMIRTRLICDPTLNIRFAQALFEQAYNHILDTYGYSAEERYLQLIERYPRIVDLVPLADIATYLNISRRQLHRIRESLSKNGNATRADAAPQPR